MMPLHDLLREHVAELPSFNPVIHGLSGDSRELQAGDAFIALTGASTHGLRFAGKAVQVGVAAILFEPPAPSETALPENAVAISGLRGKQSALADRFYGSPSRAVAMTGVTGTNGKTSTVQLITEALCLAGESAGSIGTLGAGLHGHLVAGERTTPDVIAVHRQIARMRDAGARHVAMEVSSHALDQGRVDEVAFRIAVFSNLTRDHLDYHGSMQAYGEAKAKLFAWPTLQAAVVNIDDEFGAEIVATLRPALSTFTVSSRGKAARLRAENIELSLAGLGFDLVEAGERVPVASSLLGRFNVDNLLAAAGVLRALDWPLKKTADMLGRLSPVGGRMSRVGGDGKRPLLVIDYAHTPDALEQALSTLRAHTDGRLICVFGCGGDRDRGKRPLMAAIAQARADAVIVTDDNPRTEDGEAIVAEILAGFSSQGCVQVERDRAKAIGMACRAANADDIVLIAGKGHETYQEIAGVKHIFDDVAVARRALESLR